VVILSWFVERLALERQRTGRTRLPLTLAYFDLDRFKELNEREGRGTEAS